MRVCINEFIKIKRGLGWIDVVLLMNVMLRNLGRMFSFGLLDLDSFGEDLIKDKLKKIELFEEVI